MNCDQCLNLAEKVTLLVLDHYARLVYDLWWDVLGAQWCSGFGCAAARGTWNSGGPCFARVGWEKSSIQQVEQKSENW